MLELYAEYPPLHLGAPPASLTLPGPSSAILTLTPTLNIASSDSLSTNREDLSTLDCGHLIGPLLTLSWCYWSIYNVESSLNCSGLGGTVFAKESENESFYDPRPSSLSSPSHEIQDAASGSIRTETGAQADAGWSPSFSPSDFIGSVNQAGSGEPRDTGEQSGAGCSKICLKYQSSE